MSVTGPSTTLQAILSQIQAPARPAAAPRVAPQVPTAAAASPAAKPVGQVQPGAVTQNGAADLNPNAPRGTYLNIVI